MVNESAGEVGITAGETLAAGVSVPDGFDPIAYINEPRWQTSRLGLDRIRDLLERLGRPQDTLRIVHVAGTNGKGSTCAYLANILHAAGYRTGWFSSPYIERFEERIRVDGANIPMDDLTRVTLDVREHAERLAAETGDHATEFELMTAVALVHFARSGCDIAVLEVGLGGRLDSTNVIDAPDVAVITRIGLDHTALLGDTVVQIAGEKAGIVKPGSAVVSWPQEESAMAVVERAAAAAGDALTVPDFTQLHVGGIDEAHRRTFSYGAFDALRTQLLGSYQPANAAVAIEAALALRGRGWCIPDEAIHAGIERTQWPGRFEVLPPVAGKPTVVIDGGHNPQGAAVLADSLRDVFPGRTPVLLMGVMADKDYPTMLRTVLPLAGGLVAVTPRNPRALAAGDLVEAARLAGASAGCAADLPLAAARDFDDAVARACALAGPDGLICAFGSLYAIADLKAALRRAGFSA